MSSTLTAADLPRIRQAVKAYKEVVERCLKDANGAWTHDGQKALDTLDAALRQPRLNDDGLNCWPNNLYAADLPIDIKDALIAVWECAADYGMRRERHYLERAIEKVLVLIDSHPKGVTTGIFGLVVDWDRRTVSRDGKTINLSSALRWHIFTRALEAAPKQVTFERWCEDWPGEDNDNARAAAVNDADGTDERPKNAARHRTCRTTRD